MRSRHSTLASGLIGAASTVFLLVLLRNLGSAAMLVALGALWLLGTIVGVRSVTARARREGRPASAATIVRWSLEGLLPLRDRLRLAVTGEGPSLAFTDEDRLARIADWNNGWGGDQMLGWDYLHFRSEAEYQAWAERVGAPPMLDDWDPVRLERVENLYAEPRPTKADGAD